MLPQSPVRVGNMEAVDSLVGYGERLCTKSIS